MQITQITVPLQRPQPEPEKYVGRHRWPEPPNPGAAVAAVPGETTQNLRGPAGVSVAAPAVWGYGR